MAHGNAGQKESMSIWRGGARALSPRSRGSMVQLKHRAYEVANAGEAWEVGRGCLCKELDAPLLVPLSPTCPWLLLSLLEPESLCRVTEGPCAEIFLCCSRKASLVTSALKRKRRLLFCWAKQWWKDTEIIMGSYYFDSISGRPLPSSQQAERMGREESGCSMWSWHQAQRKINAFYKALVTVLPSSTHFCKWNSCLLDA